MWSYLGLYFDDTWVGYWSDATGAYAAVSDERLKKDIEYMDQDILDKIVKLKPATYRLLHTDENDQKNFGFIAQEVQEYFPELIYQETNEGYLGLHYPDFGILAIKAIQEQQKQIEELSKKNESIEQIEKSNIELYEEILQLKTENLEIKRRLDDLLKLIKNN